MELKDIAGWIEQRYMPLRRFVTTSRGAQDHGNAIRLNEDGKIDNSLLNTGTGEGLDADTVDGAHYLGGTWNPQLQFGAANVGMTQTTATGVYRRLGNTMLISCRITLSAKGSSTGNASIAGLPQAGSTGNDRYIFPCRFVNGTVAAGTITAALDAAAPSTLIIFVQNGAASGNATDANFANNTTIQLSGWYLAG